MSNQRFNWLIISIFIIYTQGFWERIFSLPPGTSIIVELPVWTYLLFSFKKIFNPTPARSWIITYVFITFFVGLANNSGAIEWIKYIRFFMYFYFLYASLWNSKITGKQWYNILKFCMFLIFIQGLGSAFNIFVLGQQVEGHVGLMSSIGGTTASTFPLLAISLVTIVYIFTRNQGFFFNLVLLLIVISSILVGYGSGKRAIFFSIPLFIFISFLLSFFYFKNNTNFYKKITTISVLIIFIIPFYFFAISTSRGINYGLSGRENNVELFFEAVEYAKNYENATSQYGHTIGRSGTTLQVFNRSKQNLDFFLFGVGFGEIKDDKTRESVGIGYGIVGFVRDIISGGWVVMIITFLIISKIIFSNKSTNYKFTSVLRLIIFSVFVFTHFGYSSDFVVSLKVNYLLLILLIFINSPASSDYLNFAVERYFYSGLKKK